MKVGLLLKKKELLLFQLRKLSARIFFSILNGRPTKTEASKVCDCPDKVVDWPKVGKISPLEAKAKEQVINQRKIWEMEEKKVNFHLFVKNTKRIIG